MASEIPAQKKILIIEDEELIRQALRTLLELDGYTVITASQGQEGLEKMREEPHPCLVLLDLLMPVMNGMEFLAARNQDPALAAVPVCVISGVADMPGLAGVAEVLYKPVDFDHLRQVIHRFCGKPAGE